MAKLQYNVNVAAICIINYKIGINLFDGEVIKISDWVAR